MLRYYDEKENKELAKYNSTVVIPRIGETVRLNVIEKMRLTYGEFTVLDIKYCYNSVGLEDTLVFLRR